MTGHHRARIRRARIRCARIRCARIRSGGMTLVEILVVTVISVVLTSSLFLFQRTVARRSSTTDHKRESITETHRVHEVIAHALRNSQEYWVPSQVADAYDYDDATGSPLLLTRDFSLEQTPGSGRFQINENQIGSDLTMRFFRDDEFLVSYLVSSDPPGSSTPTREQSTLYSKQFFEIAHDKKLFEKFSTPQPDTPLGFVPKGAP